MSIQPASREYVSHFAFSTDNFDQSFQYGYKFIRGRRADLFSKALGGKGADLADLDPGSLWELRVGQFKGQRKSGGGLLARQDHGDDGSGAFIENVMT